jgi:hypothetical protein
MADLILLNARHQEADEIEQVIPEHPTPTNSPISPTPYCIPKPLSLQLPAFKQLVRVGVPHNRQVRSKAWVWLA